MRVVVTGGAGFIGANLCRALVVGGADVVVLDDLSTGRRENLDGVDVELHEGSIVDRDAVDRAFAGAATVVHLAARGSVPRSVADPLATHQANDVGTITVLEGVRAAGSPHLIVASSSSVYGGNTVLPKTESLAPMPLSPYAASKLATEAYVGSYARCYGIDALTFRFFNVFGPLQAKAHDYAAVVPAFVDAALAGQPLPIHSDGKQTRDFTYVGSLVQVLVDAIERRVVHPSPVNLAFGTRVSLLELAAVLESVVGQSLPREHQPPRAGDARDTQADTALFAQIFPDVTPVSLEAGLRQTVAWFRTGAVPGPGPGATAAP